MRSLSVVFVLSVARSAIIAVTSAVLNMCSILTYDVLQSSLRLRRVARAANLRSGPRHPSRPLLTGPAAEPRKDLLQMHHLPYASPANQPAPLPELV